MKRIKLPGGDVLLPPLTIFRNPKLFKPYLLISLNFCLLKALLTIQDEVVSVVVCLATVLDSLTRTLFHLSWTCFLVLVWQQEEPLPIGASHLLLSLFAAQSNELASGKG